MRETLRIGSAAAGGLSDDAIALLGALCDEIDATSTYRGSAARAAALTGISEASALIALDQLHRRRLVRFAPGQADA